jgi:Spy/CpxP family protein refolding chaperone
MPPRWQRLNVRWRRWKIRSQVSQLRLESEIRVKIGTGILALAMLAGPLTYGARPACAQATSQHRDDMEQFVMDLHEGVKRGNLTDAQKTQLQTDLHDLREAKQNHDRLKGFRAMRNFHDLLDSGAFKPEDAAKIKADMQRLRADRQHSAG